MSPAHGEIQPEVVKVVEVVEAVEVRWSR